MLTSIMLHFSTVKNLHKYGLHLASYQTYGFPLLREDTHDYYYHIIEKESLIAY